MARGLDHIVHAVSDLDAAADFYRRAGFKVGARNKHPWGTHNHVVQFPGFFIEVLTIAEPSKLGDDGLSQRFSKVLPFSREATLPDGSPTTVGFSLVFARDALSPNTTFFTCKQQNPAAFWKPGFQQHPNGAKGVRGAVLVADNPADHHIFLSAFTGVRDLHSSSLGISARTPRGDVEIMDATAFHGQFGTVPGVDGKGASLKGLRLSVSDLEALEGVLKAGGVTSHRLAERIVVPPQAAFGATLIFEAPGGI